MGEVINLQQLRLEVCMGNAQKQPRTPEYETTIHEIVRNNAKTLYPVFKKKPRKTTVQNLTYMVSSPKLKTLEWVADRVGVPVWYLLLPLPEEMLTGKDLRLEQLVKAYINADEEGRQTIYSIAKLTQ